MKREHVVAVVPARGGSKSIPRKNLRPLCGHPLLAYSIAAGLGARTVGRVLVSTDDDEIAEISGRYGAEVPFVRPSELAADDTTDLPVFLHALSWMEAEGCRPDIVVQLRPTSPLRPPGLVDEAVRALVARSDADSVRTVTPSAQNPYKMWRLGTDGRLAPLVLHGHESYNMPRQELPATYWQTGHVDVVRSEVVLGGSMSGEVILAAMVDPGYAHDLDTPEDWERVEWTLEHRNLSVVRPEPS